MRFWDASALVPLLVEEARTPVVDTLFAADADVVVWWGTRVECRSAVERRAHGELMTVEEARRARTAIEELFVAVDEIAPIPSIREEAERLLTIYPLRAADALQLAAALAWAGGMTAGRQLVCFDARLRAAAHAEGFSLLPTGL